MSRWNSSPLVLRPLSHFPACCQFSTPPDMLKRCDCHFVTVDKKTFSRPLNSKSSSHQLESTQLHDGKVLSFCTPLEAEELHELSVSKVSARILCSKPFRSCIYKHRVPAHTTLERLSPECSTKPQSSPLVVLQLVKASPPQSKSHANRGFVNRILPAIPLLLQISSSQLHGLPT